jgi:hypothetical protein
MEAMRARSKTSSIIPVEIEELNILNIEILSSWGDNTMGTRPIKEIFSVGCFTNNECSINLSVTITILGGKRELNTREPVVCSLEVVEVNISNSLSNSSISFTFPSNEIIKVSSDRSILPPWVLCNIVVIYDWLAWLFSWNHVMEDSQSVSTQ